MNNSTHARNTSVLSLLSARKSRFAAVGLLVLAAVLAACSTADLLGPSDDEIAGAEQYAASLPKGHPDKSAAMERAEALREHRRAADAAARTASSAVDWLLPGAGFLVLAGYGFLQRARASHGKAALTAVVSAVEDFMGESAPETAVQLKKGLEHSQEAAGVRGEVRGILSTLRKERKTTDVAPGNRS